MLVLLLYYFIISIKLLIFLIALTNYIIGNIFSDNPVMKIRANKDSSKVIVKLNAFFTILTLFAFNTFLLKKI